MKDRGKESWVPGWPWELEMLALIFVITAIAIPVYLQYMQAPADREMSLMARAEQARTQDNITWQELTHFFWAFAIVGLYLAHLAAAGTSIEWISTPFTHLFSPLVFSMITYYRLHLLAQSSLAGSQIVSGKTWEIALWIIGVLSMTFLVARIRMARHMLSLRDMDWEITSPTALDRSYFQLLPFFTPLVYPPRVYQACKKGILIEGWLYVMPLPFEVITSMDPVRRASLMSSAFYLATSTNSLLRIQLSEYPDPIFISPKNRDPFYQYCDQFLAAKRPATRAGDTRSGAARETAHVVMRVEPTRPARIATDSGKPAPAERDADKRPRGGPDAAAPA